VTKSAIRNALLVWLAMMLGALVVSMLPSRLPAWNLPTSTGSTASLRDLGGKPFGVLIYTSKVALDAHAPALADSVKVYEQLADNPRYAVKLVYGDLSEVGARSQTETFSEVPILLDVGKRLATELRFRHYAVVLYRANGRIIEVAKERQLVPGPAVTQILDRRTR